MRQGVDDEEEEYSERAIDIPEVTKANNSRKNGKRNKKRKQGEYVIDIEPLDITSSNLQGEDDEYKTPFHREASGRSTINGSRLSGSLDVHFHTNTATSPTSFGANDIQETKYVGDHLNKSYLETELPVYEKETHMPDCTPTLTQKAGNESEFEDTTKDNQNDDEHPQGPPKVWISRSMSMEQGLDKEEE